MNWAHILYKNCTYPLCHPEPWYRHLCKHFWWGFRCSYCCLLLNLWYPNHTKGTPKSRSVLTRQPCQHFCIHIAILQDLLFVKEYKGIERLEKPPGELRTNSLSLKMRKISSLFINASEYPFLIIRLLHIPPFRFSGFCIFLTPVHQATMKLISIPATLFQDPLTYIWVHVFNYHQHWRIVF